MVFSSIQAYFDPSNWQQQPNHLHLHHQAGNSGSSSLLPPPPPPPPPPQPHGGSIRPGSMTERARMANIPIPEAALKCPRCDSTNTKFCYFNNYSLTQPRHFCKTCRRYWTRGGALRNIPVGGGCRRNNKRSKASTRSKSPANSNHQNGVDQVTTSTATSNNVAVQAPQALHIFGPGNLANQIITPDLGNSSEIGLNYGEIISPSVNNLGGGGDHEPWRFQQLQQLPLFGGGGGFDPRAGLVFPIDGSGPVKLEENQELNLSRRFLGMLGNGDQCNNWNSSFTGTSAWANNLSAGFSSSNSARNPLL